MLLYITNNGEVLHLDTWVEYIVDMLDYHIIALVSKKVHLSYLSKVIVKFAEVESQIGALGSSQLHFNYFFLDIVYYLIDFFTDISEHLNIVDLLSLVKEGTQKINSGGVGFNVICILESIVQEVLILTMIVLMVWLKFYALPQVFSLLGVLLLLVIIRLKYFCIVYAVLEVQCWLTLVVQ